MHYIHRFTHCFPVTAKGAYGHVSLTSFSLCCRVLACSLCPSAHRAAIPRGIWRHWHHLTRASVRLADPLFVSTSLCFASHPPSCPMLPPAFKYVADATMGATWHMLVLLARTAVPPIPPLHHPGKTAALQMHAGLVGNFTTSTNVPSKPNEKLTSHTSFVAILTIGCWLAHATTRSLRTRSRVRTLNFGACVVLQKAIPPLDVRRMALQSISPRKMPTDTGAYDAEFLVATCRIACYVCRPPPLIMRSAS